MNNKKLSRLLEPNLKLYFLCMVLFCCAAAVVSPLLALAEAAVIVALYAYFTKANQKRRQGILQYIDSLTGSVDTASKSTLINSPLPIMVFRPDTGEVIWSNENFLQLAGVREHLFEMKVEDAVPEFPVQWLLEGQAGMPGPGAHEQPPLPGIRLSGPGQGPGGEREPGGQPPTGWTPPTPTSCGSGT